MSPREKGPTSWLVEVLHILVGSVFLTSGIIKGANLDGFVFLIRRFEVFPELLGWPLAISVFLAELVLGSLLVSGFRRRVARLMTAILLVIFIAFLLLGMLGSWVHECSCYGTAVELNPHWTVIQDGILVLILAFLDRVPRPPALSGSAAMRFGVILAAAFLVTAMAGQDPFLDRFLVRLRPGLEMPNLPSVAIEAGNVGRTRLVVLIDDMPASSQLAAVAAQFPNHDRILIAAADTPKSSHPDFIVLPGKKDILPFYVHHFPTAFEVVDSVVTRVWYGTLPAIDEK